MKRPALVVLVLSAIGLSGMLHGSMLAWAPRQQAVFRSRVDLIALDVQVVDKDGIPVAGLEPKDFDVTFKGKHRNVVSAELVRYDTKGLDPSIVGPPTPSLVMPANAPQSSTNRLVLLVIDAMSFAPEDARAAAVAAEGFVSRLPSTSEVGLLTFPIGPRVDPSLDHSLVRHALDRVTGQRLGAGGRFPVTPDEIIDYTARDPDAVRRINIKYCSEEPACLLSLAPEIDAKGLALEGQAGTTLQTMGSVLDAIRQIAGRKIVVLVSAGTPTTDRQGGRPDVGDLPIQLGERAAQANATVYTLFIDNSYLLNNSAETRDGRFKNNTISSVHADRGEQLLGRWLDLFAGAAGGGFMRVLVGSGESMYDRILTETSAYYLLGVDPGDTDRDGKSHELKVKVDRKGAIVRSRAWAVIPKP